MCIVRLSTSAWCDKTGVYIKKTLRYLRRQCQGYNVLDDDCSNIGADEVVNRIINLNKCKDGIYKVVVCNERSAWETPHIIEDFDYELIPLTENGKINGQIKENVGL